MRRFVKRYQLWFAYAAFLVVAILFGGREGLVQVGGPSAAGKYLVLLVYAGFLAYSLHATGKENFFKSIGAMNRLWWGRQVGIDLYISVFLSLALVYLVEGSMLVLLLWLIPVLFFATWPSFPTSS